jgi:small subunit ribosomal protein S4e
MGKKGRDTRVKRQMAPSFWNIKRKEGRFILNTRAGAHSKKSAYPLGIILRDILKVADTMYECEKIVKSGNVRIDGITVRDVAHAIGLMDIIELVPTAQSFRIVPKDSELLVAVDIPDSEKAVKLLKVIRKSTLNTSLYQYGFHDGKTFRSEQEFSVGDTCLVTLPNKSVVNHIKFEKGCTALITRGENAGRIGKVEDIREGVFSLPRRALLSFGDKTIELPVETVLAVGLERPMIKVN